MSLAAAPAAHSATEPPLVFDGPLLLAGIGDGPSLAAHRQRYGELPRLDASSLLAAVGPIDLRGRGGAGFPFAVKLKAALDEGHRWTRREIVVNVAEGEPASAKDAALALTVPHRILDGAVIAAHALQVRTIHLVVPSERPLVQRAMETAVRERISFGERITWKIHEADPTFVAGQARAVVQLIEGQPNLPVTSWAPEAISGVKGRPTLLSNAETWAHVFAVAVLGEGRYAGVGLADEPGSSLLTITRSAASSPFDVRSTQVREVPYGTAWDAVLTREELARPVLVGGFHGTWLTGPALAASVVSRRRLTAVGASLGAGVVMPTPPGVDPAVWTAILVRYLAGQSARRCGPCRNGLPALADAMETYLWNGARGRIDELTGVLPRRGACAHPDGTVRLVRSLFTLLEEI